jgi:hypothetical protein
VINYRARTNIKTRNHLGESHSRHHFDVIGQRQTIDYTTMMKCNGQSMKQEFKDEETKPVVEAKLAQTQKRQAETAGLRLN